jgi:periplasmic protein TonB
MKPKNLFPACIIFFVVLMAVSCSKNETGSLAQSQSATSTVIPALIDSPQGYDLLDQFPTFPGGDELLTEYLKNNIRYPKKATDNRIKGRVFASFIIEKNGSISNLEIIKGLGYGCDEQVLTALQQMPLWTPGKIEDQNVRVKLLIPVEFK